MTNPQTGQDMGNGLIIGHFEPGAMPDDVTEALQQAVAAFNGRHGMPSLQLQTATVYTMMPLPDGKSSRAAVSDIYGTVMLVLGGAGLLRVDWQRVDVSCGDWVFIPSGAIYTYTGTGMVTQGNNLQYAIAYLTPA